MTSKKPIYRCAGCHEVKVRSYRVRCDECKANNIPVQPVVTTSHYKRLMLSTPKIPTGVQEAKTYSDATSPYEKAVLETVTRTGQPRTEWEHIIGHPLVLETDARARQLAGIREELREHHAPRKLYRRAAKPYIAD